MFVNTTSRDGQAAAALLRRLPNSNPRYIVELRNGHSPRGLWPQGDVYPAPNARLYGWRTVWEFTTLQAAAQFIERTGWHIIPFRP